MIARRTALTAALLALAAPAAQPQEAGVTGADFRLNALLGGPLYLADAETRNSWDEAGQFEALGAEWRQAGRVADVVMRRDGALAGVVAEIGGFLDLADKHVMIERSNVKLVPLDDRGWAAVTNLTAEDLETRNAVPELSPE